MSGTMPPVPIGPANVEVVDGLRSFDAVGDPYPGPLAGIQTQYLDFSPDNLSMTALTAGVYMNSGSGDDTLMAFAGRNYLDAGAGNNLLIGASGQDSFEVAAGSGSVTDMFQNFHASDDILVTGLTAADFRLGVSTMTGMFGHALDITATSIHPGGPSATLIIPGYSAADVATDRLAITFSDRGMIVFANN
jgi:Ca2+-binding RTX toxin-like protein